MYYSFGFGSSLPANWTVSQGQLPMGSASTLAVRLPVRRPNRAASRSRSRLMRAVARHVVTATYTIVIAPIRTITTSSLPGGTVGSTYSFTLSASTGAILVVAARQRLAAGADAQTTGGAFGEPDHARAARRFRCRQLPPMARPRPPPSPSRSSPLHPSTLAITTTSLPNGTVNQTYRATLTATPGFPNVHLRPGLGVPAAAGTDIAANGTIGGAPRAPGTFTFSVQATSGTTTSATKQFSIVISDVAAGSADSLDRWHHPQRNPRPRCQLPGLRHALRRLDLTDGEPLFDGRIIVHPGVA